MFNQESGGGNLNSNSVITVNIREVPPQVTILIIITIIVVIIIIIFISLFIQFKLY